MPVTYTPLRYPGGKNALSGYLREVIKTNALHNPRYVEPYCGGAGAALNLLFSEVVSEVHLNDIDPAVYSFWRFCRTGTEELCDRVETTPLSVKEWERQRRTLLTQKRPSLDLAFAALYLNRVNRSGILRGGLIGGRDQSGPWKMDARFNRSELAAKIRLIGRYADRIHVYRADALDFVRDVSSSLGDSALVYLDPPYVQQGSSLYQNHYSQQDHEQIARTLRTRVSIPWVVSYDACPLIRRLYTGLDRLTYSLHYSANEHRDGREIIVFGPGVKMPKYRLPGKARRSGVRLAARQSTSSVEARSC